MNYMVFQVTAFSPVAPGGEVAAIAASAASQTPETQQELTTAEVESDEEENTIFLPNLTIESQVSSRSEAKLKPFFAKLCQFCQSLSTGALCSL